MMNDQRITRTCATAEDTTATAADPVPTIGAQACDVETTAQPCATTRKRKGQSPPSDRATQKERGNGGAEAPPGSKLDRLLALLSQSEGATLAELSEATGWQAHSVRGALAGALRKKGHSVASEKQDGVRRYRLEDAS